MAQDWARWHEHYDDPESPLRVRLALVQKHLADALASAPAGPITLVSLCAGQARDVIGVLPGHPRRGDVAAVLVEFDADIAEQAQREAAAAGLAGVQVRQADAGLVACYADAFPADILLLCGIFGNVSDDDIRRTVTAAAAMCRPGGAVIWTRHRRDPDLTPQLRAWFTEAGFDEIAFDTPPTATLVGVGANRLRTQLGSPPTAIERDLLPATRLFTFRS
jgi:hypothetical protein